MNETRTNFTMSASAQDTDILLNYRTPNNSIIVMASIKIWCYHFQQNKCLMK